VDEESVKVKAKKIMDDFLVSLDRVKGDVKEEFSKEENMRSEFSENKDKDFDKKFRESFPNKNSNKDLVVEKKEW